MVFDIQTHEREIFMLIEQAAASLKMPTYVVGGYVRDRLLGRPSKDMDIVCVGSCLLYTSPSPRDLSTSRMPSSA